MWAGFYSATNGRINVWNSFMWLWQKKRERERETHTYCLFVPVYCICSVLPMQMLHHIGPSYLTCSFYFFFLIRGVPLLGFPNIPIAFVVEYPQSIGNSPEVMRNEFCYWFCHNLSVDLGNSCDLLGFNFPS